jgi:photosystem II stability/assembly factor-like uncharacterized protein
MKNSRLFLVLLYGMLFLLTGKSWAQWVQTNEPHADVACLAAYPNKTGGTNLFAGTVGNGVFLSTDNGTSWTPTGLKDNYIVALVANGTTLLAATDGNGVCVSTDNGTTWTQTMLNTYTNGNYVSSVAISGTNLFAGTLYNGIFLSTDNGTTWTQTSPKWAYVNSLVVSPNGTGGTNLFAVAKGTGAFLSTDNGTNWTEVDNGLPWNYVNTLTVSPNGTGGTNLFAAANGSNAFLSTDNGTNWIKTGTINGNVSVFALSGKNIFVGTDSFSGQGGVSLSSDNSASWTDVSTGLPGTDVNILTVGSTDIFLWTAIGGIYKRSLSEMITAVKGNENQIPAKFWLDQNYPNPFNLSTTINYSLPKTGHVALKVYDVLGKEVATLVNEKESSGNYYIQFNANKLASGIYFYRLIAGNLVMTKKLILMK